MSFPPTLSATPPTPPATPSASAPADGPPVLRRLAIVVRDDAWDRLLTPLTFAWEAARRGAQVDLLFVLWAVRVLTPEGVEAVRIDPRHADREAWLRDRLARDGDPASLRDFFRALTATGRVRLHACRLAAMTFDVAGGDLLPEAAGIIDPGRFLEEIALAADHCAYF